MIRKFHHDDTNAVLRVWYEANKLAHPFLSEDFLAEVRLKVRDIYLPNTESHVVEQHGEVVGFISLISHPDSIPEVGAIFIEPAFIGKGFGRMLMDHVVADHPRLCLDVFAENTIGRRFYDRYGFKEVRRYAFEATGDTVVTLKLGKAL
ncbi:GNAT family N-acetyltransferase [Kordiimonas sp.]|uniref:GNAT family N-acetyltransferase n=1 Tax=Kordiimonas sp. TaxID=1970157 RepID=UPI003A927077